MFFQNDVGFEIYGYVLVAIAGMLIGLLAGYLSALVLKLHAHGILKDGLVGAVASTIGFFMSANMPWHRNTITSSLGEHGAAQITMSQFQYPEIVAFAAAAIFPVLYRFYRYERLKSQTKR